MPPFQDAVPLAHSCQLTRAGCLGSAPAMQVIHNNMDIPFPFAFPCGRHMLHVAFSGLPILV